MHRKAIRLLLVLMMLIPASSALTTGPEIVDNYYSDANFNSTAVGFTDRDCNDGSLTQDGTLTNYRYHEIYNCSTGHETFQGCQEYDSGTGTWVGVECPNEATTLGFRIRIPIG